MIIKVVMHKRWQRIVAVLLSSFLITFLLGKSDRVFPQATEKGISRYSGVEFLGSIIGSAREKALCGAFTSVADDVSAITKNSSGLMQVLEKQIICTYSSIYNGMANFGSVSLVLIPKSVSRIGMSWAYFVVPDIPDTRNILYTDSEGRTGSNPDEFNPKVHDIIIYDPQLYSSIYSDVFAVNALHLCYAHQIRHSIFMGVGIRYVHLRLLGVVGNTLGIDWSCMYKITNLRVGIALKNLFSTSIKWQSGYEDRVPVELSAGVSYTFDKIPVKFFSKGVVSCEMEYRTVSGIGFGGELWMKDMIVLRCGIKQFSNVSNYGVGLGIKLRDSWMVNYTFSSNLSAGNEDFLGSTHAIDILFKWGKKKE